MLATALVVCQAQDLPQECLVHGAGWVQAHAVHVHACRGSGGLGGDKAQGGAVQAGSGGLQPAAGQVPAARGRV